uniref:Uncharacterized protein n=1 Tax=Rhizophora mucronata TaxID=61149 RepID=A0A2P2PGI7_RHIMU
MHQDTIASTAWCFNPQNLNGQHYQFCLYFFIKE